MTYQVQFLRGFIHGFLEIAMVAKKKLLAKVVKLQKLFSEGKIPTLAHHEVNPGLAKGSRENYLYFTLAPCLNFQRSSPALWQAALKTFLDPQTNYLFLPEKVVKSTRVQIQKDLLKHKLALQPNKHIAIWQTISKTFHDHFQNDPRNLLIKCEWDVLKIHAFVQKERKALFPYLSGPKMANYWLYILTNYTDAQFANMADISIIPDTHVKQCSAKLGLAKLTDTPITIANIWRDLLAGTTIAPVEMHPVLWNWSRNNFLPEV